MIRRFVHGLLFGAGFALAFLVVLATGLLVVPVTFTSAPRVVEGPLPSPVAETPRPSKPEFHDLSVDERITQASAIALARYEPAPDGQQKAIITEFLKKEPDTEIYYKVGDEFAMSSYYPKEGESRGDGVVIFFMGSPAEMRMAVGYRGDRIGGLADIPMNLFKEKCGTASGPEEQ